MLIYHLFGVKGALPTPVNGVFCGKYFKILIEIQQTRDFSRGLPLLGQGQSGSAVGSVAGRERWPTAKKVT